MPDHAAPLRDRLLSAAVDILGRGGGAGLTVRAVAKAAGCSTMGVYTHFDGKPGLLNAVVEEGFADFDAHVAGAIDELEDGRERLIRGADVYRDWALAHRTQYQVMFTPFVPGYERNEAALACGAASFARHLSRVTYALERGDIPGVSADAETIAAHIWATCHGHVMLSLLRSGGPETQPESGWFEASMQWAVSGRRPSSADAPAG